MSASAKPVSAPASIAVRQQTEGRGLRKAIQQAAFAHRWGLRPTAPGEEANRCGNLKLMASIYRYTQMPWRVR